MKEDDFFRPMLASSDSPLTRRTFFEDIRYPMLASIKYDGIRAILRDGRLTTRSGRPIPSFQVRERLKDFPLDVDMEIVVGEPNADDVFRKTMTHVMSQDNPSDDLHYYVFDCVEEFAIWEEWSFEDRLELLKDILPSEDVTVVKQKEIFYEKDLVNMYEAAIEDGYEGLILRRPSSLYKNGRATWKEQSMIKMKATDDAEGMVLDVFEGSMNMNDPKRSPLDYSERSTHQENLVPSGMVGRFSVDFEGSEINVAPGSLTHDERVEIWENREAHLGKMLKFRFTSYGAKSNVPRFCRALGFRHEDDK